MDFIEENMDYILQCAKCRAIEIGETTGLFGDVEDYTQEIIVWIIRRAPSFDPRRGKPSTFISMIAGTAKRRILRRLRRSKNRMIRDAVPLP